MKATVFIGMAVMCVACRQPSVGGPCWARRHVGSSLRPDQAQPAQRGRWDTQGRRCLESRMFGHSVWQNIQYIAGMFVWGHVAGKLISPFVNYCNLVFSCVLFPLTHYTIAYCSADSDSVIIYITIISLKKNYC